MTRNVIDYLAVKTSLLINDRGENKMSDKRYAVVHFTDGTKLKLDFPKQTDASSVVHKMKNLLDSSALMVEADGSLITIPMSSIKYIQSFPCPEVLPDFAIKGASIVD